MNRIKRTALFAALVLPVFVALRATSARRDVLPDPPRLMQGYKRVTMYPELYKNLADTQKIYDEIFNLR